MTHHARSRLDRGLEGGASLAVSSCGVALAAVLLVRRGVVGPLAPDQLGWVAGVWLIAALGIGLAARISPRMASVMPAVGGGTALVAAELDGAGTLLLGACLAVAVGTTVPRPSLGPRGQVAWIAGTGALTWVLAATERGLDPWDLAVASAGLIVAGLLGRWGFVAVVFAAL